VSGWTIGWLAWLGWFGIEEGLALWRGGTPATLSGHVWKWFAVGGGTNPTAWTRIRRVGLLAFLAWLTVHFMTGGVV
jgi:hypothetical protein